MDRAGTMVGIGAADAMEAQTVASSYDPDFFQPTDFDHARSIILACADRQTLDRRWAEETAFLSEAITRELQLRPSSLLLDFGCGVGRIARGLIETSGCSVL